MKNIIPGIAIIASIFTACSNSNNAPKETEIKLNDTVQTNTQTANTPVNTTASVDEIVSNYLQLKNALAGDNGSEAASAGKELVSVMDKLNESSFAADQKKVYAEVKDDIKEHAEHISTNGGKLAHQREHFDMRSKDLYDLVKVAKPSQTLYQDHCPMYNDGKGATWLSEVKEIKNPYLGKKMPDCGTVKEEIKE